MRTPGRSLAGALRIALHLVLAPALRVRTNAWGASPAEITATLPGDQLVARPRMTSTRVITIEAPPETVWAWLGQIGHGRGGLYSYDGLENLVGCDLHNADVLLADPPLSDGDLVALGPAGYPCFRVASAVPPSSLVLIAADPRTRTAPTETVADRVAGSTWEWSLRALDGGRATRLVARQRYSYPLLSSPMWHLVEPIDFVMEREMLRGLKQRAELPAR